MVAIDSDTLSAIKALWQASAGLPALFDRAPETGRLKADEERPRPTPYAQTESRSAGKTQRYTKAVIKDVRAVTITVYGTRAEVDEAMQALGSVFHARMGTGSYLPLTFPSGATFIKWMPQGDGQVEQDPTARAGHDIWRGVIRAEVTSARSEP